MIDALITSKTRVKLLLKFFLNPETHAYLRELAEQMNESTNAVRVELDRLTEAGYLERGDDDGRKVLYSANTKHPLFPEINSAVRKYFGIDTLIDQVLAKLGAVEAAYVTGDYAKGIDSGLIDVVIVGTVDRQYLNQLVEKAEGLIHRKIRSLVLERSEFEKLCVTLNIKKAVVVWGEKAKR